MEIFPLKKMMLDIKQISLNQSSIYASNFTITNSVIMTVSGALHVLALP